MTPIPYNVVLDLKGNNHTFEPIRATVGDSNSIQLNISVIIDKNPYDLTGCTAKITFTKPDTLKVVDDLTIDDAVNGKMHNIIKNQAFAVDGQVKVEIEIFDNANGRISSSTFSFTARKGELDDTVIVSTNEFAALNTALSTVNNFNSRITANANNITSLQTQVANIGTGSPKAVYATLSALQTAFPTGTTGVYLVTADGKWYYWNGTAWTPGGTYQSTGISDKYITKNMINTNVFLDSDITGIEMIKDNQNRVTQINDKNGSTVINSVTINRDTNGLVANTVRVVDGKTLTVAYGRDKTGAVTSITRNVV